MRKKIGLDEAYEDWANLTWTVTDRRTGKTYEVQGASPRVAKQKVAQDVYGDPDRWADGTFDAAAPGETPDPKNRGTLSRSALDKIDKDFTQAKGAGRRLTAPNIAIGTPKYMPPEQWMGRTPDPDDYVDLGKEISAGWEDEPSADPNAGTRPLAAAQQMKQQPKNIALPKAPPRNPTVAANAIGKLGLKKVPADQARKGKPEPKEAMAKSFDVSDTPQEPIRKPQKRPPPLPDKRPAVKGRLPGVDPRESADSDWEVTDPQSGRSVNVRAATPIAAKYGASERDPSFSGREFDVTANPAGARQTFARGTGTGPAHPAPHGVDPTDYPRRIPNPSARVPGHKPYFAPETKPGRPEGEKTTPLNPHMKTEPITRESSAGGSLAGFQMPIGDDEKNEHAVVRAIRGIVREIIRKKEGGGGYILYSPNRGKKKPPKAVGEFPTRTSAKKAELARFPPKDGEQLKRARKRIEKLSKDPKKRAEKEREELSSKPKGKSKRPSAKRAKRRAESLDPIRAMARQISRGLTEALFREDEVPGSPWDERLSSLSPEHLAADRRLHTLHKGVERGSLAALGEAQKGLARALKKLGKLTPGEPAFDASRRKHFMPCVLACGDTGEIGPIHLYVDGGHVRVEVSRDAQGMLQKLDPETASDFRGRLVSFQEVDLPKISAALDAVSARDAYLDKLHDRLDQTLSGMTPVQMHLMRQLMRQRRR